MSVIESIMQKRVEADPWIDTPEKEVRWFMRVIADEMEQAQIIGGVVWLRYQSGGLK